MINLSKQSVFDTMNLNVMIFYCAKVREEVNHHTAASYKMHNPVRKAVSCDGVQQSAPVPDFAQHY